MFVFHSHALTRKDLLSRNVLGLAMRMFPPRRRYHPSVMLTGDLTHCKPIPVMKTGFSLCTFPNREKPVFITGIPANAKKFFPVWEKYTGKTLFWPCTGPVRDCSVFLSILTYLFMHFLTSYYKKGDEHVD